MTLPNSNRLPINYLSAVFNNTTNSYKFYWFLSIISQLKKGALRVLKIDDIVFDMITKVWYPINYYRISFGKQDKFTTKIEAVRNKYALDRDIKDEVLFNLLKTTYYEGALKNLFVDLTRYVPYRFLTPWFSNKLKQKKDHEKNRLIIAYADKDFANSNIKPLYRFLNNNESIEFDTDWLNYITNNLRILEDFTLWNLSNYLRKHNPNVPNIQEKLFSPEIRDLSVARKYWIHYLKLSKEMYCIYSNQKVEETNWSIDHFLPWSFAAHDQLWNLVPVPRSINSIKSDNIPSEKYLQRFSKIQFDALRLTAKTNIVSKKLFEDYSIIFNDTTQSILKMSEQEFTKKLVGNIKPLMQIAINMGFEGNWVFKR